MIQTVHLFPVLDQMLIELLTSLSPDEWNAPTIAKLWTVKDVATHLLDGNVRTLSLARDKHTIAPDQPIQSYQDLVGYLNQLNADWVRATKRLSPSLLTHLLTVTGKDYCNYMATLRMEDEAIFSVAWAGEQTSKNWFHIAREYTEKWHHQQQIRDAVNKPGLLTRDLYYPFIETLLQGLPHTFKDVNATIGTTVEITIETEIGGSWYLIQKAAQWQLSKENAGQQVDAQVSIHPDIAWKLFTKGMSSEVALKEVKISGDQVLASQVLKLIAVMA